VIDVAGSRERTQWRLGIKVSGRDTFLGSVSVGAVIAKCGGGFLFSFRFPRPGQQSYRRSEHLFVPNGVPTCKFFVAYIANPKITVENSR
jgi:hypothetical protein